MSETSTVPEIKISPISSTEINTIADSVKTRLESPHAGEDEKQKRATRVFANLLKLPDPQFTDLEAMQMREEYSEGGMINESTSEKWRKLLVHRDDVRDGKYNLEEESKDRPKPTDVSKPMTNEKTEVVGEKPPREKTPREKILDAKDLGQALVEYNSAKGNEDPDLMSSMASVLAREGKIEESIQLSMEAAKATTAIRTLEAAKTLESASLRNEETSRKLAENIERSGMEIGKKVSDFKDTVEESLVKATARISSETNDLKSAVGKVESAKNSIGESATRITNAANVISSSANRR